MSIDVMEDDGARNNWRKNGKEVKEVTDFTFTDEDFKEPMPSTPPVERDQVIQNLKKSLEITRKNNAELKEKMQDMRRSILRPNQVQDDEELALLTNEKAHLEEKVVSLQSKNEQMVNTVHHLSEVVKKFRPQARITSNEDFTQRVQNRIKQCTDILFVKNKEYSSDTDRLHNFKVAAQLLGSHPVQALKGMMVKHEVSIFDMCCDVIEGQQPPSYIMMDEKFGDIHNYYYLLEALLEEYRDAQ